MGQLVISFYYNDDEMMKFLCPEPDEDEENSPMPFTVKSMAERALEVAFPGVTIDIMDNDYDE